MTAADLPRTLALAEVAREAGGRLHGDPAVQVRGLTHDSRRVRPGMLFCALAGRTADGGSFVADALARGAAAVLGEAPPPAGTAGVEVPDARAALGRVAHAFWGDPSAGLRVVGVTGTNGKTTSSFLVRAVLEEAFGRAAALGTLGLREGGRATATGFTTPEAPELAELLAGLVRRGVRGLAMEVSSHALVQGRVRGVRFAGGLFTNLTHEHLDFHGTLDAYREAKLGFFDALREADGWGVVNLDDPSAEAFRRRGPRRILTVSQERPDADVLAESVEWDPAGSRVRVAVGGERLPLHVRLGGRFNVSNALGALAAGIHLGLAPARAAAALGAVERVPGRFELLHGAGRAVLIDYAHTPDAFERVLDAARPLAAGSVTLIFGCGGERDREKRPRMGEIAGRLADRVLLTIDNPRREPLERIMEDVAEGLRGGRAAWARHDDRASAVRLALRDSAPGDLIVLLGKGDEGYQDVNGVKHPYSDRETARAALAELESAGADCAGEGPPAGGSRAAGPGRKGGDRVTRPASASGVPLSAARVVDALGRPAVPPAAVSFVGVDTDSRAVRRGGLFVGVRGERHDGSAFAAAAVRAGAAAAVARRGAPADLPAGAGWWTVADGVHALGRLALAHRRSVEARVICVTGSNGKTGTKELVAEVLATRFEVARTRGNLNNQVGLPLSLLDLEPRHEWGVFEIGTNRPGEIARLAGLACPEIGVITNVAPSHLEGLGSLEGVVREKTALAAALGPDGTLVYGGDGPLLREAVRAFPCRKVTFGMDRANDVRPDTWELDGEGRVAFRVSGLGEVRLRLVGLPSLLNALAAVTVGRIAGLAPAEIRAGLERVEPLPLRLEVTRAGGVTVIQDCYNANPDSMRRGVETLRSVGGGGSRVAVLGGMRELGDDAEALHYRLGGELAAEPLDLLVVYGEETAPLARGYQSATEAPVHLFRDRAALVRFLAGRVAAPATVLFKASRGAALETAAGAYLDALRARPYGAESGPARRAGRGAERVVERGEPSLPPGGGNES